MSDSHLSRRLWHARTHPLFPRRHAAAARFPSLTRFFPNFSINMLILGRRQISSSVQLWIRFATRTYHTGKHEQRRESLTNVFIFRISTLQVPDAEKASMPQTLYQAQRDFDMKQIGQQSKKLVVRKTWPRPEWLCIKRGQKKNLCRSGCNQP